MYSDEEGRGDEAEGVRILQAQEYAAHRWWMERVSQVAASSVSESERHGLEGCGFVCV